MPDFRPWTRIVVLSDITAGRTNNWMVTHRRHNRTLVRSIRRKPSADRSSIFQLEHVIRRLKVTNPNVIARVEKITMPMVNVLPGRPAGWPDLNSIKHHWVTLNWYLEKLGPATKKELVHVVIMASEGIEMSLVNNLLIRCPNGLR
jgi:hypothetical protein